MAPQQNKNANKLSLHPLWFSSSESDDDDSSDSSASEEQLVDGKPFAYPPIDLEIIEQNGQNNGKKSERKERHKLNRANCLPLIKCALELFCQHPIHSSSVRFIVNASFALRCCCSIYSYLLFGFLC